MFVVMVVEFFCYRGIIIDSFGWEVKIFWVLVYCFVNIFIEESRVFIFGVLLFVYCGVLLWFVVVVFGLSFGGVVFFIGVIVFFVVDCLMFVIYF